MEAKTNITLAWISFVALLTILRTGYAGECSRINPSDVAAACGGSNSQIELVEKELPATVRGLIAGGECSFRNNQNKGMGYFVTTKPPTSSVTTFTQFHEKTYKINSPFISNTILEEKSGPPGEIYFYVKTIQMKKDIFYRVHFYKKGYDCSVVLLADICPNAAAGVKGLASKIDSNLK